MEGKIIGNILLDWWKGKAKGKVMFTVEVCIFRLK